MNKLAHRLAALGLASVLASCASSPESLQQKALPENQDLRAKFNPGGESARAHLSTDSALTYRATAAQDDPNDWPAPVHDNLRFTFIRAEQLETRFQDSGPNLARWEVQGWHGTDYNKLWIKSEGEQSMEGASEGDTELQALYSRLVAPFWDFQVGARYDRQWGSGPDQGRWFAVVGVQGFAPYEFETELALFVSEDADLSARLTASTDFLITQRLILQPRFETELAIQEVSEFQVGQGMNYGDFGLRLRYEIRREFAPYLGVNWLRSFGESEDLLRRSGGEADEFAFVLGVSMWF